MAAEVPEDGPEFEAMMREIDSALTKQGVPITARPIMAGREISLKYKITFPMFDPPPGAPPELRRYGPLSTKVNEWFKAAYGDRLNIDFSPGHMVLDIDGDLYRMRLPRFWGQGECLLSRHFLPKKELALNKPFELNILECIDGMTEAKAQLISNEAATSIFELFAVGLQVTYCLENLADNELIRIARSDMATAVDKLIGRGDHFGDSKWASLQAAEKCLKAAIELEGVRYKPGHKLKDLSRDLANMGIQINAPALLDAIQCGGGIRYGEEPCTREEALSAHHAFFRLVLALLSASRKFRPGVMIRKLGQIRYDVVNVQPPPRRR